MSLADLTRAATPGDGPFVDIEGDAYLRIAAFDRMPPFLMSLPSDTDLWSFVSSAGGLTAGRVSPDQALFPYVTVDLLHDAHHASGPFTELRVERGGEAAHWRPFDAPGEAPAGIERNLYKNTTGDRLIFEEVHHALGLAFRARWGACGAFGHVRTVTVVNLADTPVRVHVLDGFRHVLPAGAPLALYQHSSSLVDAYKRTECDAATGLGIFALTSRITDRAEPGEMLRANVAWVCGLPQPVIALSLDAIAAFRRGEPPAAETLTTGRRGHYLAAATLDLAPRTSARWHLVADAARSQAQVAALRARLRAPATLAEDIEAELRGAHQRLRALVASADGVQRTGAPVTAAHHFANVLFNVMRGGVCARHHDVPGAGFAAFVAARDARVAAKHAAWLATLPEWIEVGALGAAAAARDDASLERLAMEYLPIHFGRRHGDPSRPWNRFAIHVQHADGTQRLAYEGNWRDIFQNWEALAVSFPAFLPSLIAKFVNASTVDGFNPYRLTQDGIEWEVEEPGSPWSNIGYWGDHQVVYLLRFLEALQRHQPGALDALLARPVFAYADVPYRLAPFARLLADPRATIAYDHDAAARIAARVHAIGRDGVLCAGADGTTRHVTLLEKLLVPVLSKLSNFVPGAGIWMNTQRPEWNDANNALVGHGVSVVTLAQLRRHLAFLRTLLASRRGERVALSAEVGEWLRGVSVALQSHAPVAADAAADGARMALFTALGEAFSRYRERVYAQGLSAPSPLAMADVLALIDAALAHADLALDANVRADALVHAYNLLEITPDRSALRVHRLQEMLEGQVAALGSGRVAPAQAVQLLDALFASRLYRADQQSFVLYPERDLPAFLEKNVIPERHVAAIGLFADLLAVEDARLVVRDVDGAVRFHPDFRHAGDVAAALDALAAHEAWREAVTRDRAAVLAAFEDVFHHHAFTGRSGTMYGYEGIGSVYWHMVAKLLLAVQEMHARALR